MSEAHAPLLEAEPPAPPRAIVAAHGQLGAGMVSAVAQITGRGSVFVPLSNAGLGREQLEALLRERLDETGVRIVFTDLPAGSWTIAARRLQREQPELVVVTGVNLAMLLEFVFHESVTPLEAAAAAVEKGRSAMLVAGGTVAH